MRIDVIADNKTFVVEVPELVLDQGGDFFQKMDKDMDNGWQMSREWVENPNTTQRCQIAADRLLASLQAGSEEMAALMAGYIVSHLGPIKGIRIDTTGEMTGTEFITE